MRRPKARPPLPKVRPMVITYLSGRVFTRVWCIYIVRTRARERACVWSVFIRLSCLRPFWRFYVSLSWVLRRRLSLPELS